MLGLISILIIASEFFGVRKLLTIEFVQDLFARNFITACFIYILLFTIGNLLQIPGWIFLAGSIIAIGEVNGFLITLISAWFSCVVGFFIVGLFAKDSFRKIESSWVKSFLSKMDQYPISTNAILRVVFQNAPLLNYSLALSGISFRSYFLGALIGLPISILIYTLFINEIVNILLK